MGDLIDDFRARVSKNNSYSDGKSGFMYNLKVDFEQSLLSDASSIDVEIYKPENQFKNEPNEIKKVIINEIATNDQKSFDEKYLLSKVEDKIEYGMYIKFNNWFWIVNFEEYQTHSVYRKHVIRRCNKIIKYTNNYLVYEIPVVAKNLTQYSDGMQDIKYTSLSDNRISLMFGVNVITDRIRLGDRIIVGRNVYRTTFIEDYQFNKDYKSNTGLGNLIMIYEPAGDSDGIISGTITQPPRYDINGEVKVMPGGKFTYAYDNVNVKNLKYEIEYTGIKKDYVKLENSVQSVVALCNLRVDDDLELIGESFKLKLMDGTNVVSYLDIKVSTF